MLLETLAKKHDEWIRMAIASGSSPEFAKDIVQVVYLRIHKYQDKVIHKILDSKGQINMFYMWGAIRNTTRTEMGKENKYLTYGEFYSEESEDPVDLEFEANYQKLMNGIQKEVDSWGAYNSKLFNLYFKTDFSMRKIAKGTGIGLTHIFSSVNKYKKEIKDKFGDEFNELNN